MPYAIKGNIIIKKDTGKVVGHSENPKAYIKVLQAVEHGWQKPDTKHGWKPDGSKKRIYSKKVTKIV